MFLPHNVKLVVSTLPKDHGLLDVIRFRRYTEKQFIKVSPLHYKVSPLYHTVSPLHHTFPHLSPMGSPPPQAQPATGSLCSIDPNCQVPHIRLQGWHIGTQTKSV